MPRVSVKKKPLVSKPTPEPIPPPKFIDILHKALQDAGIKVKRDGWLDYCTNKEGKWSQEDPCEWLDIHLKDEKGHKHLVHFYFHTNSTVLEDVQIFIREKKKGFKEAKLIASTKNVINQPLK